MKEIFRWVIRVALIYLFLWDGETFAACNVSTIPVNFGNYNVFSPVPLDTTGAIIVTCDERPAPRVTTAIGPSPNSGGFDPRMMKQTTGSDLLGYNLYLDSNRTRIWGDGSGNTFTISRIVRIGRPWVRNVYGRIPPGQDVSAGFYTDTLTVTITW